MYLRKSHSSTLLSRCCSPTLTTLCQLPPLVIDLIRFQFTLPRILFCENTQMSSCFLVLPLSHNSSVLKAFFNGFV